jgi:signal transduction histidine kinase
MQCLFPAALKGCTSKHKSQFLANMSHELRTPPNAIIGVSEMLREDADAAKQDLEPLDRVLGAGRHLLALINDILDLSKIEAGLMELQLETFPLAPLIADVVKTIEPLANHRHRRYRHRHDGGADGQAVSGVLASRRIYDTQIWRHGAWSRDQQALPSNDGRRHHGEE